MGITLEEAKSIAILLSAIVAALTFIKAVIEYTKQNAQKRAELFTKLRESFKAGERFTPLFELLDQDDEALAELPYPVKQDFLGFYEDIALLVNSGLLKRPVAHYMFAYYAIRCWESKYFWQNMNRDSVYWSLFRKFVEDMKAVERKLMKVADSTKAYRL